MAVSICLLLFLLPITSALIIEQPLRPTLKCKVSPPSAKISEPTSKVTKRPAKGKDKKNATNGTLVEFQLFGRLPPELRDRIFEQSLLRPGVHYFNANLRPNILHQHCVHIMSHPSNKHSAYRQHKNLMLTCKAAKETLQLVKVDSFTYRAGGTINLTTDLVVFQPSVVLGSLLLWQGWHHMGTPHNRGELGRQIQRVGVEWNKTTFFKCFCPDDRHPISYPCPMELVFYIDIFDSIKTFYFMIPLRKDNLRKAHPSKADVFKLVKDMKGE